MEIVINRSTVLHMLFFVLVLFAVAIAGGIGR